MDPRESWNAGADAWREFVRSGADFYRLEVHGPALLECCSPLAGTTVLDLGCGEGYFSRELARNGAHVSAVDLAEELLRRAEEEETRDPLAITYVNLDARDVASHWQPGSFDLITACMSLQDMTDAATVLSAAATLLRPRGRLAFSVPHPCTDTPVREWLRDEAGAKLALAIDHYFEGGESVMHWNMPRLKYTWRTPHWRRTLQEWTEMTMAAGFLIRRLLEPRPTAVQVHRNPNLDDCARLPYFLIIDARLAT